ncbi:restriction endonuclease subunit S [Streptococcus suis]|nr:restriction endonuclease subunit S [Streptococcus suis]
MSEVGLKLKKLGELVEIHNNKRIPLSSKERANLSKIYPYYGAQGIVDYVDNYIFDGKYILIAEDGENLKSNNKSICTLATGKYWVNNHAHIVRANNENDTDYLFYKLNSISFLPYITGSAQPKLNKENLLNIPVYVHEKAEQKNISKLLSKIDQKIALNNQINEELEAMAKTLYDYWFVQFDFPDENGKPYKSSGGKMVYNDQLKREIPEGWGVENLSNFLTIKNGKDHKDLSDGNYPVYGSGGLMRKVEDYIFEGESVLIPRKGTLNNIMYVDEKFWTVDTMFYTHMKIDYAALYTYFSIKDIDFTKLNTGTGVPSMTASILYQLQILNPNADILKNFDELVRTTYRMIFDNRKQNQELTQLRDWLLPMLMNGQVKVEE